MNDALEDIPIIDLEYNDETINCLTNLVKKSINESLLNSFYKL